MSICPNKSSKEWQTLEKQVGTDLAYATWMYNGGEVPSIKTTTELRQELKAPAQINESNLYNMYKNIRIYNKKNGTSHSVKTTRVGESQRLRVALYPNYLPVNVEKQRQRTYERTARITKFTEAFNETYKQGTLQEETPSNEVLDTDLANKLSTLFPEIEIQFQEMEGIAGQANLEALQVLLSPADLTEDTLPHEYAHHYISWFRETPLVQEAIKKYGSEEALAQAIGEQVVKQGGEAYNWWKKFTKWVQDLFNNLSNKSKEELRNILTDAMLTRTNIETGRVLTKADILQRRKSGVWNQAAKATKSKKEIVELKDALETIMYSLNNRIKALKMRGKGEILKSQQDLYNRLEKQYREAHYLDGITSYLDSAADYMTDLLGADLYTDANGVEHAEVIGTLEAYEAKVESASSSEIINYGQTIRQMGNFAASYHNTTTDIIQALTKFKPSSAELRTKVSTTIKSARGIQSQSEEIRGRYAEISKKALARFLIPFGWQSSLEQLEKTLSDPAKDISGAQRWLDALVNANDDVLNLLAVVTTNYKEKARKNTIDLEKRLIKLKKRLEANGITTTEWMIEKSSSNIPTGNFVTEYAWGEYQDERYKMFKRLEEKYGVKYQNRDQLSATQIAKYKKEVREWFTTNTMSNTDALVLIEKQQANLPEDKFQSWFKLNVSYDQQTDKYTIPKKKNPVFAEIMNSDLKKEYYETITELKLDLEKHFPEKFKHPRRMPQLRKDAIERIKVGDIKGIANNIKEHFKVMEDEDQRGTDYGIEDERGNVINFIPIFYTNRLKNMKHLSTDVTSSMMEFARMAIERDHMQTIVDMLEIGKDVLLERKVAKTNNKGHIVKIVNNILGKRTEKTSQDPSAGNIYKMYETYLDMIVYGRMHKQEYLLGKDISKFLDFVGRYTSVKQLGLNSFAATANLLTGKAQLRIESASKEFFGYNDLLYADKLYSSQLVGVVGDIGQRLPSGKLTLWNERMNILEDFDERIRSLDVEQKKAFTRMFRVGNLFFLSHMGEHYLHSRGGLAIANEFRFNPEIGRFQKRKDYFKEVSKLKDQAKAEKEAIDVKQFKEEGRSVKAKLQEIDAKYDPQIKQLEEKLNESWKNLTNYWDAHEVVEKELKLKPEFKNEYSDRDMDIYTALTRSVNQSLHGIYNTVDKNAMQQIAVGRLLMMFRKWMKPAWNRRFQKVKHDYRRGSEMEGYYATTFRFMSGLISDLRAAQFSIQKNWSILTDHEKANMRRSLAEVSYLFAMLALGTILANISGSDDDDWVLNMMAYQANRQVTEIGALVPFTPLMLTESLRLLQRPMAATSMASELVSFATFWNWGEELSRGKYKGMTKLEKSLIRTIPPFQAVHDLAYPEEKLAFYMMFR